MRAYLGISNSDLESLTSHWMNPSTVELLISLHQTIVEETYPLDNFISLRSTLNPVL
jgi:hypothetical protein